MLLQKVKYIIKSILGDDVFEISLKEFLKLIAISVVGAGVTGAIFKFGLNEFGPIGMALLLLVGSIATFFLCLARFVQKSD